MTPNRHERRKAKAMNSSSALFSVGDALLIVTETTDLITSFFECLRDYALTHSDVVYKQPVLFYSASALSFGEAEDIKKVLVDNGLTDMKFEAFGLAAHFGGKTVKDVVDLFLAEEETMREALMYIVTGFTVQEYGVTKHPLLDKYATSLETVFDLLGVPRQQNG